MSNQCIWCEKPMEKGRKASLFNRIFFAQEVEAVQPIMHLRCSMLLADYRVRTSLGEKLKWGDMKLLNFDL